MSRRIRSVTDLYPTFTYEDDLLCDKLEIPYLRFFDIYFGTWSSKVPDIKADLIQRLQTLTPDKILGKAVIINDTRMVKIALGKGATVTQNILYNIINYNEETAKALIYYNQGKLPINIIVDIRILGGDYKDINEDTVIYLLKNEYEIKGDKNNTFRLCVYANQLKIVNYLIDNKIVNNVDYLVPIKHDMCYFLIDKSYRLKNFNIERIMQESDIDVIKLLISIGLVLTTEYLNLSIDNPNNICYFIMSTGVQPNEETLIKAITMDEPDEALIKIIESKGVRLSESTAIKIIDSGIIPDYIAEYLKKLDKVSDSLLDSIVKDENWEYLLKLTINKISAKRLYDKASKEDLTWIEEWLDKVILDQV